MTAFVILALFSIRGFNDEVYSSIAQLATVFNAQREIVEHLERYIEDAEAKTVRLRKYVEIIGHFEGYIEDAEAKTARLRKYVDAFSQMRETADVDEIVGNPLSAYQLIKLLAKNWASVEEILDDNSWLDPIQQIQSRDNNTLMPTEDDVKGAALAFLRLQETYRLNASDLVRGNILGIHSLIELTTGDCVYLGNKGFNQTMFELAIAWYGQALRKSINETNPAVAPQKIMEYLDEAIKRHNTAMHNKEYRKLSELLNPIHSASTKYKLGLGISQMDEFINYHALCRGEQLRSDSEVASLNCYFSDGGDASFYINPIKVEVHSHDPQILTFHDIIYETEIDFIKEFSKPSLKRSKVSSRSPEISDRRTSQNSWMYDDVDDAQLRRKVKIIMDRVSSITGLNVHGKTNSEAMQVANYGIGGEYARHHNFLYKYKSPQELSAVDPYKLYSIGDRIATLMFYLSDVELGGATVFPLIGAAVRPRKGSAFFWYNVLRNGEGDRRTLHGGCPVLLGSKWIGNKWIHEVNQVFKRPCSLNPRD